METLAYPELFALQDQVLSTVFSVETSFYLTGGTCLHRFHCQRRHSIDLDLFTNDPALFRDDVRTVRETLIESQKARSLAFFGPRGFRAEALILPPGSTGSARPTRTRRPARDEAAIPPYGRVNASWLFRLFGD